MFNEKVSYEHTFDILYRIVSEAKCKPRWRLFMRNEDGALRLVIRISELDNYTGEDRVTDHYHPVPITTYNETAWRQWIYERCIRTMHHEIGEALRFGPNEERPFAPMHGPGEDPYGMFFIRSEKDALTTQDGSLRSGPV